MEFFLSGCEGLRAEDVVMMPCKALSDKLFVKTGYTNKIALHNRANDDQYTVY